MLSLTVGKEGREARENPEVTGEMSDPQERAPNRTNPARVVADADVLVADILVGEHARDAIDCVRRHSWMVLVATPTLLDDAAAIIGELADDRLATEWRELVGSTCLLVDQRAGDHPALAAAHNGNAAHILSFDEELGSPRAGAALRRYVETSVKRPEAFATLFDPEGLYPEVEGGEYPGPDTDPRG